MRILIAGQGLAGSVLALELIRRGVEITIADRCPGTSSTRTAAGVIRPVTGRRLAKTYQADRAVPLAFEFYSESASVTGVNCIHQKDVLQLFSEPAQQNEWYGRASESGFENYIGEFVGKDVVLPGYASHQGGVYLKNCGYLETGRFIDSCREYFRGKGIFLQTEVRPGMLIETNGAVLFQDVIYDKVVFCEGALNLIGSPFSHLPFRPVKGEVIDFEAPGLDENYIVNHGKFILPVGDNCFRTGSTYSWHDLDESPTPSVRKYFESFLDKMLTVPYKITGHLAGVRPAVVDRRPIVGMHPKLESFYVFNGLGSKGVMLAPYYARQLADLIIDGIEPDPLVSIRRFSDL